MDEFELWLAILIFCMAGVADVIWTLYIRRTSQGKAFSAASLSFLIFLSGGFVVREYVKNIFYLGFAALGAFIGTWITIKYEIRKRKKEKVSS